MSEQVDRAGITDEYVAEIKGPNPKVWGNPEDRPPEAHGGGVPVGEIVNEDTPDEVKGPSHEWEQDENGEYVNR